MTNLDRLIDELAGSVATLNRRKQAAFFAACAEALLPLYENFSREVGWGDVGALRARCAGAFIASSAKATGKEALFEFGVGLLTLQDSTSPDRASAT